MVGNEIEMTETQDTVDMEKEQKMEVSLVGTWKLTDIGFAGLMFHYCFGFFPPQLHFSKDTIVYEFNEDGVLNVSGNLGEPEVWFSELELSEKKFLLDMYSNMEIGIGIHSYLLSHEGQLITINNKAFDLTLHESSFGINITGLGGYSFIKVK
jgi:hypothetical protein